MNGLQLGHIIIPWLALIVVWTTILFGLGWTWTQAELRRPAPVHVVVRRPSNKCR